MRELSSKLVYRFADVEIDAGCGCVRRGGEELHLRQQTFQVLLYLIERRDRLVTKEELFEQIWKGTAVTDNALLQCIFDIRRTLGDDSRRPRFIKTFPKAGYRFVGSVEFQAAPPPNLEFEEVTSVEIEYERESHETTGGLASESRKSRRPVAVLMVVGLLVATVAVFISARLLSQQGTRQEAAEIKLPHADGRPRLAVMFFENQTGDAETNWLREGLADMLITDLSRSRSLSVLGRQQLHLLFERAGYGSEHDIRLDEALSMARGVSAEAVVLGSFAHLGGKIRVDAQLYDVSSGKMLAAEQIIADEAGQLLTQIDILSLRLAAYLGDARDTQHARARFADVMTDNLEAYRFYSLAVDKAQAMHNEEAIALLKKAIELDPEFAMAYGRIGYAYAVTGPYAQKARPYLEKAFRLAGQLTEKDRLYIVAWYAIANLDYPGAIGPLREVIARYPLEVEAYLRLGYLLRGEGQHEEALETLKLGLTVEPQAKDIYNALGLINLDLKRYNEAIAAHRRYVQLAPSEPNAYDSLGMSYQCAGLYDEAVAAYEQALSLNPGFSIANYHLGNLYVQTGRYEAALARFRRGLEIAPGNRERAVAYDATAQVYLKKGDLRRAAEAAQAALRQDHAYAWASWLIAMERKDLSAARKLKERFSNTRYTNRGQRLPARWEHYARGQMALIEGRGAEALDHFEEALRHAPLIWTLDLLEDCLGKAYLELGMLDEAIAEYERILGINPNYPLASYHLAQAYERKGQQDRALVAYAQFLKSWKDADADVPEVSTARRRSQKG